MGDQLAGSSEAEAVVGVGLDEALEGLRAELASAHAKAAGTDLQFPVVSLSVEFWGVGTRWAGGKAGFRVPVVGAELGGSGSWASEATQTVTLVLSGPVDRDGVPQRVARVSDEEKG